MTMVTSGYRRTYTIRKAQRSTAKSLEVTFPWEVAERAARQHGLTLDEFIQQFQLMAEYDGFEGVRYYFVPRPNNKGGIA